MSAVRIQKIHAERSNDTELSLERKPFPFGMILILIYFVVVALKLLWVSGADGPILFYDEFLYKSASHSVFLGNGYTVGVNHFYIYPPLYPLTLVPSFFFGDSWYEWMLRINVLISSTLVFPVWLIARRFLPRRESLYCVLISAFLPFHVVSSRMVMSENLFLPLFALAVYTVVVDTSKSSFLRCLATGAVWGLAYLTRHIFLVAIPVLFLMWWIQPWITKRARLGELFGQRMVLGALVLLGFIGSYAPWVLYSAQNGVGVFSAMGITQMGEVGRMLGYNPSTAGPVTGALSVWLCFYLCYGVLVSAPYIQLVMLYPFIAVRQVERGELFVFVTLVGLTGIFAASAAYWNSGTFGIRWTEFYLDGRYMMYSVPLLPILAFASLQRLKAIRVRMPRWAFWLVFVVSVLLVYAAYSVLITRNVWQLPPWFANITWIAGDVLAFNASGSLGTVLVVFLFMFIAVQTISVRRFSQYSSLIVLAGILILQWGSLLYISGRFSMEQELARHGKAVAHVLKDDTLFHQSDKPIHIILDSGVNLGTDYYLGFSLAFWDVPSDGFEITKYSDGGYQGTESPSKGLLLTRTKCPSYLATYQVDETAYYVCTLNVP